MGLSDAEIEEYRAQGRYTDSYDRATEFRRHGFYGRGNTTDPRYVYLKNPDPETGNTTGRDEL